MGVRVRDTTRNVPTLSTVGYIKATTKEKSLILEFIYKKALQAKRTV